MNKNELAAAAEKMYAAFGAELKQMLEGVSEAESQYREGADEWSVQHTLAHLITVERASLNWVAMLLDGLEDENIYPGNDLSHLEATARTYGSMRALLEELERNHAEVVKLLANLPDEFVAHKSTFWRAGYGILAMDTHSRDHLNQARLALKKAKKH